MNIIELNHSRRHRHSVWVEDYHTSLPTQYSRVLLKQWHLHITVHHCDSVTTVDSAN